MGYERDIVDSIHRIAGRPLGAAQIISATVKAVDQAARTCTVVTVSGSSEVEIDNVQLMAGVNDGLLFIPAVGSSIAILTSVKNLPLAVQYSEITDVLLICDNVEVNTGNYGGLVKVADLTTKLNRLVSQLQTQLGLIAAGIAAAGGSYTPGTITTFNRTDYENDKFKHGG